ncbi:MAG: UDP-N-acetylglucosamine--N-acetylmuramyl-(pentapeptide) pyrophosphoryl-undecaprenol N-acetylglucosamine transferase [Chloroflexota bacterium]
MYPALAVLQALQTLYSQPQFAGAKPGAAALDVLWVGGAGGIEAGLVKRAGVPFEAIPAAGLHGVGWQKLPGNLMQLLRGYRQARQVLRRFRPQALFFTGGYVAGPVALAGRAIPQALFVPDIEPGQALRFLARTARRIAVTAPDSAAYFAPGAPLVVTGYPVRPDLARWQRAEARQALGIAADLPTLLVFGGSKGARSINRALLAALPQLLERVQVVHISGALDWPEVEAARQALAGQAAPAAAGRYHAFEYLHEEMGAALAAADLVVARAGASTLGEFPLFGLPAILAPYPHAWRYQRVNAEYLQQRGAALMLPDEALNARLASTVLDLFDDAGRLQAMRSAALQIAQPDAARSIARLLIDLAGGAPGKDVN